METLTFPRLLGRMWGVASDVTLTLMGLAVVVVLVGFVIDVTPSVIDAARGVVAGFEQRYAAANPQSEAPTRPDFVPRRHVPCPPVHHIHRRNFS